MAEWNYWNRCPGCGMVISGDAEYCPNCGEPWTIECPSCGEKWRFWRARKFCPYCGTRVETSGLSKRK
jgi:predicted amidophosphoribosyltransferase